MIPKREQRKRTKGYKSPDNCRYVGRGTIFGNPFKWQDWQNLLGDKIEAHQTVVKLFDDWLDGLYPWKYPEKRRIILDNLDSLREYEFISCFCPPEMPCRCDVYIGRLSK
jgi:hypothetical protein